MQVAAMIHDMYNIHGIEDSQGVQPFTEHTLSRYYSPNKSITVQSGKVQTKDITHMVKKIVQSGKVQTSKQILQSKHSSITVQTNIAAPQR